MKPKILVALSDSMISQSVLDHMIDMEYGRNGCTITLFHVFRKATAEETLMGKKFSAEQQPRMMAMLEKARDRLVEAGYNSEDIDIVLESRQYPTVAEGIIEQFTNNQYKMVLIGRKQMSKSEEFALGDISVRLIRTLKNTAIVVVKAGQNMKLD